MPTVEHKDQPSISGPVNTQPIAATAAQTLQQKAAAVAAVVSNPAIDTAALEAAVKAVLQNQHKAAVEAAKPKEPNWATLTEQQAYAADTYIPVVDHEVADYMNIQLKDPEYEAVWVHHSPRRLGQKLAEGFKLLTKEDVNSNFTLPLMFDSEGVYRYEDTVAMIVHKRFLYGKRRKALQVSLNQLSNRNRPPRVRVKDSFDLTSPVIDTGYGSLQTLYSDII